MFFLFMTGYNTRQESFLPSQNSTNRTVTCDFFQVHFGRDGQLNFSDVVNTIHANYPSVPNRNVESPDGYMRIHGWHTNGAIAYGTMLHLRQRDIASIGRLDTDDLTDLNLSPQEALTEYFCFRYFDEFKTLVVHRNRYAGNCARLTEYLQRLHPACTPASFEDVLTGDAWRTLQRMYSLNSVEVTVARPQSLAPFDTGDQSVSQMAHLTQDSGAETLTLHFSMGHTNRPLNQSLKGVLRTAMQTGLGLIKKANVRGKVNYQIGQSGMYRDELTTVDLIENRMRERIPIDVPSGRMTPDDYQRALIDAYNRQRGDIEAQFALDQTRPTI